MPGPLKQPPGLTWDLETPVEVRIREVRIRRDTVLHFRSIGSSLTLYAVLAVPVIAQTVVQPDIETPAATLKIDVRTVLVDVVVTDKSGHAVPGLRKEDFEVSENGKRQTIDFFEPHFATANGAVTAAQPPRRQPSPCRALQTELK